MKPKECINQNCKNVFYVKETELKKPLQCEKCIIKRQKLVNQ